MTLRRLARFHAALLLMLVAALLVAPGVTLAALAVPVHGLETHAAARMVAGILGVLAAALWGLGNVPPSPAVVSTALLLALSHGLLALLLGLQQVAIWNSSAGWTLVALSSGLATAYVAAAVDVRRPVPAPTDTANG
jgi:hypothetical protein